MASIANLGLDFNSITFYLVNFGVVFLIIYYFFSKPIQSILSNRQKTIKDNIDEAERMKQELTSLKEKYDKEREQMLIDLDYRIFKSTELIKQKNEDLSMELSRKKSELIKRANAEIDEMKKAALNELRNDITKFISDTISEYLSENTDSKTVSTSIEKSFTKFFMKYE